MARMEATVTIARPVEEVFRFFLALDENAPKVDPGGGSVVKSPEGPPWAWDDVPVPSADGREGQEDDDAVHRGRAQPEDRVRGGDRADAAQVRPDLRAGGRGHEGDVPRRLQSGRSPSMAESCLQP